MSNAQFNTGTRSQPLGDPKAGVSADLDALAAYVASLGSFRASPLRNSDGSMTAAASRRAQALHVEELLELPWRHRLHDERRQQSAGHRHDQRGQRQSPRRSADGHRHPDAAGRLGDGALPASGLGSHRRRSDPGAQRCQPDRRPSSPISSHTSRRSAGTETTAPGGSTPGSGTGLTGRYFNNTALSGAYGSRARGNRSNFTWSGFAWPRRQCATSSRPAGPDFVEAAATGNFQFQTRSNDGVRLWIDGNLVIDNWAAHGTTDNQSATIALVKNQRYAITMEYYDNSGSAVAKLFWKTPTSTSFVLVPRQPAVCELGHSPRSSPASPWGRAQPGRNRSRCRRSRVSS